MREGIHVAPNGRVCERPLCLPGRGVCLCEQMGFLTPSHDPNTVTYAGGFEVREKIRLHIRSQYANGSGREQYTKGSSL